MMEEKAGTSKDKKRKKRFCYTRHRIGISDFPLGVRSTPYNLIEDICAQGPKITWTQLLHMVPKLRRQWSSMVSTRKSSKSLGLIKAQDIKDILPVVEAKIKGHSISKVYVDWGAQMCVMKEKTMHQLGLVVKNPSIIKAKLANNMSVDCMGKIKKVKVIVCGIEVAVDMYVLPSKGENKESEDYRVWDRSSS